jgi:AraC-like DNA-binding protein
MGRVFTTEVQPSHKQLAWWQEVLSDIYYNVEVYSDHTDGLHGKIVEQVVGDVSITHFSADSQRVLRTREKIAADNDDAFVLVLPRQEHLFYNQSGRNGFAPPGSYVLVQTKEYYELSCPDSFRNVTVKMPAAMLRGRLPLVEDHCACAYPNDPVMGGIIRDFVLWVADHHMVLPPNLADEMGVQIIDMVAAMLESEVEPEKSLGERRNSQLRRRIQRYVSENLLEPDLTPSSIAKAFGISTSYVHRLFRPAGVAPGRWIMQNRLQRGYEMLTHHADLHLSIAEIAYASGFSSQAHFSKAFRRQFNVAPREARKVARDSRVFEALGQRTS